MKNPSETCEDFGRAFVGVPNPLGTEAMVADLISSRQPCYQRMKKPARRQGERGYIDQLDPSYRLTDTIGTTSLTVTASMA
jgi:hypothetical protein